MKRGVPITAALALSLGALLGVLYLGACNRSAPPAGGTAGAPAAVVASVSRSTVVAVPDAMAREPEIDDLWARAKDGEADDLARLARREGPAGLMERGADPAYRDTAVRALGQVAPDAFGLGALAWLAEVALGSEDGEAGTALESIVDLAAQPRRAHDPEDALELHAGCERLLGLARDGNRSKKNRVIALRGLRMLSERGCVKAADLLTDLDGGQP